MLVLAANGFAKYNKAIDYCQRKDRTLNEVEKVLFGVTHAEAGAYILGLWKIPPVIVEAVLMHQQPSLLLSANWSPLSAVHVADALLHECENGAAPYPGAALDQPYIKKLGLSARLDIWRVLAQAQLETVAVDDDQ
jgi:HD-like signal output (HDOD) protein